MLRYCLGHCIKEMQLRVKPWKKLNITLIWSLEDMALIFFFPPKAYKDCCGLPCLVKEEVLYFYILLLKI